MVQRGEATPPRSHSPTEPDLSPGRGPRMGRKGVGGACLGEGHHHQHTGQAWFQVRAGPYLSGSLLLTAACSRGARGFVRIQGARWNPQPRFWGSHGSLTVRGGRGRHHSASVSSL